MKESGYGLQKKRLPAGSLLSGKWGSNPRPSAWEADALPSELLPHLSNFQTFILISFAVILNLPPNLPLNPKRRRTTLNSMYMNFDPAKIQDSIQNIK